jgi:hypothetical protein
MHFSDEFLETSHEIYDYFRRILKLPESQIYFYAQESYLKGVTLIDRLHKLVSKNTPLVIYYGGHGLREGWRLSSRYTVPYAEIVSALQGQRKPLIILNDCCFGMALEDYLSQLQCRHLLLGLSPKTLLGYGSLVSEVIEKWKSRKPADPAQWVHGRENFTPFVLEKCGLRLRRGNRLDYLCYPKSRRL